MFCLWCQAITFFHYVCTKQRFSVKGTFLLSPEQLRYPFETWMMWVPFQGNPTAVFTGPWISRCLGAWRNCSGLTHRRATAQRKVERSGTLRLGLASTFILGSESRGTQDHILLSHDSFWPLNDRHGKLKSSYDRRSVGQSWCQAPSGAQDQILVTVGQMRCCRCGAPSLTLFVQLIFKNPVRTSQETNSVSITTNNRLRFFREIITVYSDNHKKNTNTLCGLNAEF
jgi:hypothetical protein